MQKIYLKKKLVNLRGKSGNAVEEDETHKLVTDIPYKDCYMLACCFFCLFFVVVFSVSIFLEI